MSTVISSFHLKSGHIQIYHQLGKATAGLTIKDMKQSRLCTSLCPLIIQSKHRCQRAPISPRCPGPSIESLVQRASPSQ